MSAAAPAPGGRRGLADSPLFAFFHALSFCVELFKREIRDSFMLMYRTKAAALGRRLRRCPEAGVAARGGRRPAARVSRVPQGLTKQPLIPANTKPLLGLGLHAACTRARAPPRRDGWHRGGSARFRPGLVSWAKWAWGRTSVNPARVRSRGRVVAIGTLTTPSRPSLVKRAGCQGRDCGPACLRLPGAQGLPGLVDFPTGQFLGRNSPF